jgi:hypothetical protein
VKGLSIVAPVLVIVFTQLGPCRTFEWDLVAEILGETFGTTNAASRIVRPPRSRRALPRGHSAAETSAVG